MDRQDIIIQRIIKTRIAVYAVILILWLLMILLFGFFSVIRTGFITVFFGFCIFKSIKSINNYSYSDSITREILYSLIAPLAAGIVILFTFYPAPSIEGKFPFQYSFSKMYTQRYCAASKDLLPGYLPSDVSDYYFSYFSGFMQADPMLELSFKVSREQLERIEKSAEYRSAGVLDLDAYRNYDIQRQSGDYEVTEFKEAYFKSGGYGYTENYYFAPRTGQAGSKKGSGKLYILESNGSSNHPHTSCITVNYDTCTVSYTY